MCNRSDESQRHRVRPAAARVSKATLYVLHAVPASMPLSWRASERLELLTELRTRAEREGVAVRVVRQHGDPAGVIVLHPHSKKADVVVLDSNRRRGWQRFREGSVVERVLRRVGSADCSVDIAAGTRVTADGK